MTNTTVAISAKENIRLTDFCKRYNLQKKEFFKVALDYFEKNGIDPQTHLDSKSELGKIIKRIDQLFAFMKVQEKEYLRPSVQAITTTEFRLNEKINTLATVNHLGQLPGKKFIDSYFEELKKDIQKLNEKQEIKMKVLHDYIVKSHSILSKNLEEIKSKKGFSF